MRKKIEGLPGVGGGKDHLSFGPAPEQLWEEEKDEHWIGSTSVFP